MTSEDTPNLSEAEIRMAQTAIAQQAVDLTLAECRANDADPIPALDGLIATSLEVIAWAEEAKKSIERSQNND